MALPLGSTRPDQARRYVPLVGILAVLLIAFLVLPSSLTLPQANPSTTLQLAPIPPTGKATLETGNFSSLSLAGSPTLGAGPGKGTGPGVSPTPPGPLPGLAGGSGSIPPETYNCVDGRQTADPLAPPCSAYRYTGNNGGSTYQGVTGGLIKIIIYYDANPTLNTARGEDQPTPNSLINLDAPPQPNEIGQTFTNRAWEKYFNLNYQTYNRHVQFWVQYSGEGDQGPTASTVEADAAFAYQTVHPFAIINEAFFGFQNIYTDYMAAHGVVTFGSQFGNNNAEYQKYPGHEWGYLATIEQGARYYANFVCTRLYGQNSDDAGGSLNGIKRKFGFMEDGDSTDSPYYVQEDQMVLSDLKQDCGLVPSATVSFPHDGYAVDNSQLPVYATQNMAKFSQDGITTILWPVGYETKQTAAAAQINYVPEWITGDDPTQYSYTGGSFQDPTEWGHAWAVTTNTYVPVEPEQICYQAYRTVDDQAADSDIETFACQDYNDLRQLFIGIQVAGPKLDPASINEGFRAIPTVASTNPQVPACFYPTGEYTCVHDVTVEHWNPNGQAPNQNQPGCWVMQDGGRRYLNAAFTTANLTTLDTPSDFCNGYNYLVGIDQNPPPPP
ncbi:MAG: hypothetical protein ACYCZV_03865 [Acidimicrobiales bacterium]